MTKQRMEVAITCEDSWIIAEIYKNTDACKKDDTFNCPYCGEPVDITIWIKFHEESVEICYNCFKKFIDAVCTVAENFKGGGKYGKTKAGA